MPKVTRCVCYEKPFTQLKAVADNTGATTLEELQEHIEFGKNCRLCNPYVRLMLRTGETAFDPLSPEQIADMDLDPS